MAGHVEVGEGSHIGIGVSIIQGIKIGKWCTIGAGTVIIKDVPDGATVVGNPGKIIKIKDISNLWLKNGYSLNKEPGKIANRFERYYTGIYFPFEKSNFEDYSYYYIDKQNYTYWYSFNKSSKRLKHYISLSKSLNMITESKIFD